MARASLAALILASATAFAQNPPAPAEPASPAPAAAPQPAAPESTPAAATPQPSDQPETPAPVSAEAAWLQESTEERRKLELFVLDGYLRVRPDLFHKFDLNRGDGGRLWPGSPVSGSERTMAGVNMRWRLDPTLNVSEEVRVRAQIDAVDNLIWGSTPAYRSVLVPDFGVFNPSQGPTFAAINRVYGEVSTPVGIFRFGRMGSHWGLGMYRNDGNCFDCDFGDTVDRFQFVTEPFSGWFVAPMIDFNSEGAFSSVDASTGLAGLTPTSGQPFDLSNLDDDHSLILAIARRDTEQQAKAKLDNNQLVINGGLHFAYRTQRREFVTSGTMGGVGGYVQRNATLYTPDVWLKVEHKDFRVELEAAATIGSIGNRAFTVEASSQPNMNLSVLQYGGVLQGEYRGLVDGKLRLIGELGFASGDPAWGLGSRPGLGGGANGQTVAGDIQGPQYDCPNVIDGPCADRAINNFRFNPDYRIDMILWREILGPVTDALYAKPTVEYQIADGFDVFGSVIYSRTLFTRSAPAAHEVAGDEGPELRGANDLGLEVNVGARYETEDGFYFGLQWGLLLPLDGLKPATEVTTQFALESAQAVRAQIGVKF